MEKKSIYIQKYGSIGWIVLNQPSKRNAITKSMWESIPVLLEEAEKDETETRIIQPNCPYSKGESIIMGASTDDPENIALFSKQNKYLYCGNVETVCSEGYELNHSQKCKDFYKEFDFDLFNHNQGGPQTPPVSCCLPKPGQCKFSEIVGEGKPYRNIFDGDNDLQRLRSMNINQLRRIN